MASFYVKPGRKSWALYQEQWTDGKRTQVPVPRLAYPQIGIDPTLTLDEARERVKIINKEKKLERLSVAEAARQVTKIGFYDEMFFPENLIDLFTERVRSASAGNPDHVKSLFSHFKFVQGMIKALKVLPKDYHEECHRFYQYMIKHKCSVDYSKKLITMLNMWGRFVSKKQGSFFENAPMPPRRFKSSIAKAQRQKKGVRKESGRLTLELLKTLKVHLPEPQYNWLYASLWLGLRPIEVDQLSGSSLEINTNSSGIKVLVVNQTKIEGEDETESFKYIPILFPEQETAIKALKNGLVERPKPKELQEFTGEHLDVYCGRKGFVDLMQSRGQQIDHASIWMGHKDLKTTLRHYKDPMNVPFTVIKTKSKKAA